MADKIPVAEGLRLCEAAELDATRMLSEEAVEWLWEHGQTALRLLRDMAANRRERKVAIAAYRIAREPEERRWWELAEQLDREFDELVAQVEP